MKNQYLHVSILFLFLFSSVVHASVEASVLHEFQKNSKVNVIVELNRADNLSYNPDSTFKERLAIAKQKNSINLVIQNKVLSDIHNDNMDVYLESITGRWFAGSLTQNGLAQLMNDSRIKNIYYDSPVRLHMDDSAGLINASYPWDLNYTGAGQRICVIDSGVHYQHLYLGNCDHVGAGCKIIDGYDRLYSDDDPEDTLGHGTQITGMIISNATDYKGIAPGAEIVALKVMDEAHNITNLSMIGSAIDMCWINFDASIITMSLGRYEQYNSTNDCPTTIRMNANDAYEDGVFLVASSGNMGYVGCIDHPACLGNVTSVGAVYTKDWGTFSESCTDDTTSADKITCFTNRGADLDLLGPGAYTTSTKINDSTSGPWFQNHLWGTSLAAPVVAAGAAILREINPDFTPDQLKYILTETGKPVYDVNTSLTFPRIDLYNATLMALRSQVLEIENDGDANLTVTNINSSEAWIVGITPTSFTLVPSATKEVLVTVDEDQIAIGTETGDLKIYSNDPDESVKTVPVTLRKISEGCTGDCYGGSGDWDVDSYTAVWFNGSTVSGDLNIEDSTLFWGELSTSVSGSLNLDEGALKLDDASLTLT